MENNERNKILIPVDFTDSSLNAVRHGAKLADHLNYEVSLLHVINKETKSELKKSQKDINVLEEKLKNIAIDIRKVCKATVDSTCAEGSIYYTINEVADQIKASVIVLATHGKTGIQYLTGSRILKVITNASIPVIVVQKRSFEEGYRNIIFPLNNFTETKQKLRWSIRIAKTFGSKLHLYEIPEHEQLPDTKEKIDHIKSELTLNSIPFIEIKAEKRQYFADQLLEYSVACRADLIMIMTNPDDITPSFLLGPWDERIIYNTAQIPVMCINPRDIDLDFIFPVYY